MPLLDTVAPEYEVWERHCVALPVASERALDVAVTSPVAPDAIANLMRSRGFGVPRGSIEEFAGS